MGFINDFFFFEVIVRTKYGVPFTYYANRNSQRVKKLKHFSEPIHILSLVFHQGMNIAFERDGRIFVSENFG